MKMLRNKSLFSLIYAIMLAIPLVAVLSKVIYVQLNKNAYQSYYGDTINEEITNNVNIDNLIVNQNYTFQTTSLLSSNSSLNNQPKTTMTISEVEGLTANTQDIQFNKIEFYYADNMPYAVFYQNTTWKKSITMSNYLVGFKFKLLSITNKDQYSTLNYFTQTTYNKYSYLDNVFEYAVDQTIAENNYGNIPLVDWLSSMFLSDNQVNNRYIHYANWYMNYILMISCAYILFLVLMWFINFARKLLERGMNYDF